MPLFPRLNASRLLAWIALLALPSLAGCSGCGGPQGPRKPRASPPDDPVVTPAPQPKPDATPTVAGGSPASGTAAKPAGSDADLPLLPTLPGAAPKSTEDVAAALARRREAAARLGKLFLALDKFRGRQGRLPDQAIVDREGRWLLSWRVQLLPYLGRQDLYARFKLDEAWNSPHNLALLREIPDEYKSAERNDEKTCFQVVTGPKTAYESPAGLSEKTCPDGLSQTLVLVETNPELAKPWTQPDDYKFDALKVQQDLFTHRLDGALVLFGGSEGARLLPATISDVNLLSLLTPAGKEPVDAEQLGRTIGPQPHQDILDSLRAAPITRQLANLLAPPPPARAPAAGGGSAPTETAPAATNGVRIAESRATGELAVDGRAAPPSDAELADAADQIRKLYADEYKTSKKVDERRQFAKKLLDEAKQVEADPPAYFVMLRAARDIAAGAGDLAAAIDACGRLKERFQIDEFATYVAVLEQTSPHLAESAACDLLYDESMRLAELALERDDFSGAKQSLRLAQGAARRTQKQDDLAAANRREDEVNAGKLAFQKIAPHLHVLLRNADDPTANGVVGRYTALVKRDWTKGLEMLARGEDSPLKKLADADRANPTEHEARAALADAWWDWSEKTTSPMEKASAQLRAIHWYKQAIPGLPPSLARVRAERRVADVEQPAKSKKALRGRNT